MCGLVAFSGAEPDPALLVALADEAERRGPHGWGAAWIECGEVVRTGGPQKIGAAVRTVLDVLPGPLVLHARLATSGIAAEQSDVAEGQPLLLDGRLALAHNGTVSNYSELVEVLRLVPRTPIDSEVVLMVADMLAGKGAALPEALSGALAHAPLSPHAAVLLSNAGRMAVARRAGSFGPGHPLWWCQRPEGTYVCSRRPGPGWAEVPDDSAWLVPAGAAA